MVHIREAMSTSFVIALLGFFESSVAAKSLGGGESQHGEGLQGIALSANRELVALGVANLVGGCFMALPAFGGYGRSKVNATTGGKTPMSSIVLSVITVICVLFLLPYFYYLPKSVLSAMISVVAYSLIEEAPHDIRFFVKIRGYAELGLMALIILATVFYSLNLGIALGIGLSLLAVIRHATKPRIQILGKVPDTSNQFENAEDNPQALEFIEGCLIVKIPEPLTFANTGELKNRLRRLELYGTTTAHPALPRVRSPEHNSNVIFDIHGVTGLDGSGTQVMAEIVESYRSRGVRVFFCRVPKKSSPVYQMFLKSGIVEMQARLHLHAWEHIMLYLNFLIVLLSFHLNYGRATSAGQPVLEALDDTPVVHFTLNRRGGAFEATKTGNDSVDMNTLVEQLANVESRYNLTRRVVKGNKLVRKAKALKIDGQSDDALMGDVASNGTWHAMISIGDPPQETEMDLNMLTLPSDLFHLPTIKKTLNLPFAYCRPLKTSLRTLRPSGCMLGLAPSDQLSQTGVKRILQQLLDENAIERPIFSLMLINGREGVLSVGGTVARAVDLVVEQTANELDRAGAQSKIETLIQEHDKASGYVTDKPAAKRSFTKRRGKVNQDKANRQADWENEWTWNDVQGAEGWWQTLMQGLWVDGSKVLQNQAVVFDINSPFILAPPLAAKAFYASIAGSRPLEAPFSNFYAFPCINPPSLEFEFHGRRFPVMRGGRGRDWNSATIPGGRLRHGSGYCIGMVVETRMGLREEKEDMTGSGKQGIRSVAAGAGSLAGNGMRDVWVMGEAFFRSIGGVYDVKEKRIGVRTY
ncbi:MAG: hypothetical protein Q9214_004507 [Letrouitia sp. 1 TL-2023]